jgi:hypothetical protein
VTVLATSAGDILDYALAAFFIASGAGLLYLFVRMGGPFARLSSFIKGTERDLLPVIVKSGGTVDRINDQLDKLDTVTDSAVSMADSADTAVRAVSTAITTPSRRSAGSRQASRTAYPHSARAATRARRFAWRRTLPLDARRSSTRNSAPRPARPRRSPRAPRLRVAAPTLPTPLVDFRHAHDRRAA